MATKKKAAPKSKKAKGESLTWAGGPNLRVLLADGSTVMVCTGETFDAHPDWIAAVRERQPEKAELLK